MAGCLAGWLDGWLTGWLVGYVASVWLFGWLAGWVDGWLTVQMTGREDRIMITDAGDHFQILWQARDLTIVCRHSHPRIFSSRWI